MKRIPRNNKDYYDYPEGVNGIDEKVDDDMKVVDVIRNKKELIEWQKKIGLI